MNKVFAIAAAAAIVSGSAWAIPTSVELPGKQMHPESITSTADGTLYIGSFAEGGIQKAAPGAAKAEPFIEPGAFGTRSILGVLADEKAGILWACSNDISALGVPGPSQVKGSFLKGFDLKTGEGKVSVQMPGEHTLCNDIAVGPDGAPYVTNSLEPKVFKLVKVKETDKKKDDKAAADKQAADKDAKPKDTDKLEVFVESPLFNPPPPGKGAGLDGIAFGADGNLYLNKFTEPALFQVVIKNGKVEKALQLKLLQKLTLADALRPVDGGKAFLMIEGDGKLDRVTVSGDQAMVETLKTGLNGPTGVTPVGTTAWVVEGQLPQLFDPSKGGPKLPFTATAVPLTP